MQGERRAKRRRAAASRFATTDPTSSATPAASWTGNNYGRLEQRLVKLFSEEQTVRPRAGHCKSVTWGEPTRSGPINAWPPRWATSARLSTTTGVTLSTFADGPSPADAHMAAAATTSSDGRVPPDGRDGGGVHFTSPAGNVVSRPHRRGIMIVLSDFLFK